MTERTVYLAYAPGDHVIIDNSEITARITEISICAGRVLYRAEWMHNGTANHEYFDAFRLKAVDA
jgi:hypothetical protein